jgi:hypothetical protein
MEQRRTKDAPVGMGLEKNLFYGFLGGQFATSIRGAGKAVSMLAHRLFREIRDRADRAHKEKPSHGRCLGNSPRKSCTPLMIHFIVR